MKLRLLPESAPALSSIPPRIDRHSPIDADETLNRALELRARYDAWRVANRPRILAMCTLCVIGLLAANVRLLLGSVNGFWWLLTAAAAAGLIRVFLEIHRVIARISELKPIVLECADLASPEIAAVALLKFWDTFLERDWIASDLLTTALSKLGDDAIAALPTDAIRQMATILKRVPTRDSVRRSNARGEPIDVAQAYSLVPDDRLLAALLLTLDSRAVRDPAALDEPGLVDAIDYLADRRYLDDTVWHAARELRSRWPSTKLSARPRR